MLRRFGIVRYFSIDPECFSSGQIYDLFALLPMSRSMDSDDIAFTVNLESPTARGDENVEDERDDRSCFGGSARNYRDSGITER